MVKRFKDPNGLVIRLTDERVAHILEEHPDIKPYIDRIGETITGPDFIAPDPKRSNVSFYVKKFKDLRRYPPIIVVVAKLSDSFVVTAHFARSAYVKRKK